MNPWRQESEPADHATARSESCRHRQRTMMYQVIRNVLATLIAVAASLPW
jgi:hypothetical protein